LLRRISVGVDRQCTLLQRIDAFDGFPSTRTFKRILKQHFGWGFSLLLFFTFLLQCSFEIYTYHDAMQAKQNRDETDRINPDNLAVLSRIDLLDFSFSIFYLTLFQGVGL